MRVRSKKVMTANASWVYLFFLIIALLSINRYKKVFSSTTMPASSGIHNKKEVPNPRQEKLESGWDERGIGIYKAKVKILNELSTQTINISGQGNSSVSTEVNHNNNFWNGINRRARWEPGTFAIFKKYVTPKTIMIDFGTWIGPTLLYHRKLSKQSYDIEDDPTAYAVGECNANQNRYRGWGDDVFVESACVSTPKDIGTKIMTPEK